MNRLPPEESQRVQECALMVAARRGQLSGEAVWRCPRYRVQMTSTVETPPSHAPRAVDG